MATKHSRKLPRTVTAPHLLAGVRAEDQACCHLVERGGRILARNLREKCGEIDILAELGGVLIFVEVRWRAQRSDARASITARKRSRIRAAAQLCLQRRFASVRAWPPCRFDVIVMDPDGLDWIPNAFSLSEDF